MACHIALVKRQDEQDASSASGDAGNLTGNEDRQGSDMNRGVVDRQRHDSPPPPPGGKLSDNQDSNGVLRSTRITAHMRAELEQMR